MKVSNLELFNGIKGNMHVESSDFISSVEFITLLRDLNDVCGLQGITNTLSDLNICSIDAGSLVVCKGAYIMQMKDISIVDKYLLIAEVFRYYSDIVFGFDKISKELGEGTLNEFIDRFSSDDNFYIIVDDNDNLSIRQRVQHVLLKRLAADC